MQLQAELQDEKSQKNKYKNSSSDLNLINEDQIIIQQAVEIEKDSCLKVKQARLQLEQVLTLQEATANELKKQGEILKQTTGSSLKILENSKLSSETQYKIKEESRIFPSFENLKNKIKRWWNKNVKMENEIEEIKSRNCEIREVQGNSEDLHEDLNNGIVSSERQVANISNSIKEDKSFLVKNEIVKGENDTNKELNQIFNTLKKINVGARNQINLVKEQKANIKDISKLNEFSTAIVEETESQINKKN